MKTSLFEKNLKENTVNINITNFIETIKHEDENSLFEKFFRRFIKPSLTDVALDKYIFDFLRVTYCKDMPFLRLISKNKSTITYEKKEFLVHGSFGPFVFDNLRNLSLKDEEVTLININFGLHMKVYLCWFLWELAEKDPKIYEKTSDLNGKMTFKALNKKDFVLPISVENFNLLVEDEEFGKYFSEKSKRK